MQISLKFLITSIQLDIRTMQFQGWSLKTKLEFILKKYYLIVKHLFFKKFELGSSKISINNQTYFYDSPYGLATFQSMVTRHNRMIDAADIKSLKNVIDCGANVGFYSIFIKDKFKNSKIYAIEPVPEIYNCLESNASSSKNIRTYNYAISDKLANLKMKFNPSNSVVSKVSSSGNVSVEAITLDKFIEDNNIESIDLLKIDTEGYEKYVLGGAKKALSITKYLAIELNFLERDYSIASLMKDLVGAGYDFQIVSYRNYSGNSEGRINLMDCMLVNQKLN